MVFTLLCIGIGLDIIIAAHREERRQVFEKVDKIDRKAYDRGMEAKKSATVDRYADELENTYKYALRAEDQSLTQWYADDVRELREYAKDLVIEEWIKKADKKLERFWDSYLTVTIPIDEADVLDIEQAVKGKKRCLQLYRDYFSLIPEYRVKDEIDPLKYMKDNLGDLYQTHMESEQKLEAYLSQKVLELRPEYKRVMKLYDTILEYVWDNRAMRRSETWKNIADDPVYSIQEVEACYRELVKKGKVIEYKLNGKYYCRLSDKEAEIRKSRTPKKQIEKETKTKETKKRTTRKKTITSKIVSTETLKEGNQAGDELESVLLICKKENLEYADKRDSGGCLWVKKNEKSETVLRQVSLSQYYIRTGCPKVFDKQPALYFVKKNRKD